MIKNNITLKQLEALVFVVDLGTFRAAASALGTTQPNISSRIATLESALSETLLHRDAGSIRLTSKGALVLEKAREVLWATEALVEAAERRDLIEERLRLGVTELVACTWLQPFLRALRTEYPALRVELVVDLSKRIDEKLLEGELDLAVQSGPFKSGKLEQRELTRQSYVWVANQQLSSALPKHDDVARFFEFSVLTHAKHTNAGHSLHKMASERGLDAQRIVHSSALSACIPMVCEGLGVALLPQILVQNQIADGTLQVQRANWHAAPLRFYARYDPARVARFVRRACEIAEGLMPVDQEN